MRKESSIDQNYLNGGNPHAGNGYDATAASIDPKKLPRNPYKNCAPVYPWNFVRDNTVFGVIHEMAGTRAWADKHAAYSSGSGPGNGNNVDDFFGPEINSVANPSDPTQNAAAAANQAAVSKITTALGESCKTLDLNSSVNQWTDSFYDIRCYDQIKVNAIVNEIHGMNHLGTARTQVPAILGMNFQVVSVGQKLIEKGASTPTGGYLDGEGTPSAPLLREIEFVDAALAQNGESVEVAGYL